MVSGHTPWKGIVRLSNPDQLREQLGYVDGYMLMGDDLLRELNNIEQEKNWSSEARELLRRVRRQIHNLRSGAKATQKFQLQPPEGDA